MSSSQTAEDRDRIQTAVSAINPQRRKCFANALQLCDENPDVTYVEGFAVPDDADILYKHAWNLLDGKFVDITPADDPFQEYCGVVFDDPDLLSHYVNIGQNKDFWGIMGNHHNNHQYLRDHGFL